MAFIQLLLLLGLLTSFSDAGAGIDPEGVRITADEGSGLDPHGRPLRSEDGSGLDPHGGRATSQSDGGVFIDPNG